MSEPRTVMYELTGDPRVDGRIVTVAANTPTIRISGVEREMGYVYNVEHPMVPTGNVRWIGDHPVEVYVPAAKLDLWRAEHDAGDF